MADDALDEALGILTLLKSNSSPSPRVNVNAAPPTSSAKKAKKAKPTPAPPTPTPSSAKKSSKRDSVAMTTRDSVPTAPSPTLSPVPAAAATVAGNKRKRAAQSARPVYVASGNGGAVVVRDRNVSVSDCTDPDSLSLYDLCRRWMQDDAHLRPRAPIPLASFSLVDTAALLESSAAQRKALLAALQAERQRVIGSSSPTRAGKKRAANVVAALADSTSSKAPPTKALLNEFVSRAKRERKQWQTRFDERVRLADDVLRHSRQPVVASSEIPL